MSTVPELFGSMVFDDKVMRARLSAEVYKSLRDTPRLVGARPHRVICIPSGLGSSDFCNRNQLKG